MNSNPSDFPRDDKPVDDSIDSEILDSMERDYIGPVVHIHASVSSMSEEFEAAVQTACAADAGLKEMTYPIAGDQ